MPGQDGLHEVAEQAPPQQRGEPPQNVVELVVNTFTEKAYDSDPQGIAHTHLGLRLRNMGADELVVLTRILAEFQVRLADAAKEHGFTLDRD